METTPDTPPTFPRSRDALRVGLVAGLVRVLAFVYYREHGRAFPPARQRSS